MASNSEEKGEKKKRGPGRPSKKQPPSIIKIEGIVKSPMDAAHRMEAVCPTPTAFKNLFTYFKNNGSDYIHMRCSKDGIAFFARDTVTKTRIMAFAAGQLLAWYYFADKEPYFCTIKRESVEALFVSINKTFNKLQIQLRHDNTEKIIFILKDPEIEKECSYEITLCGNKIEDDLLNVEKLVTNDELKKYPIEFTLSAKQLKKTFVDAFNQSTDYIMLEKIGSSPLQFSYQIPGEQQYYEVYKDPKKIDLRSEIKDEATFYSKLNIATVKTVANNMITEKIKIYCKESGEIVFRSAFEDKALTINAVVGNTVA